jgi:hypothetical protein
MRDKRIAAGLALLAAALAVVEVQIHKHVFPHNVDGVLFYGLVLAGCVLVVRGWRSRYGRGGASVRPLKPGESYERPVKLAVVDNVPMAELWRQRLHAAGIDAAIDGTLLRNPAMPVTLLVGEHDVDRARSLFPELQQPR